MSDQTQVFLSYDGADVKEVQELADKLRSAGLSPWMDKEQILAGANWDRSIKRAIRDSSYFVVCLTRNSVTKRGYLQKEISEALELQREQLEDDRYIIPVRLEECSIPDRLAHLQTADLFENDGLPRLLKSLGTPQEGVPSVGLHHTVNRASHLSVGGVPLPCFFPSMSGAAKNSFSPLEHLKVIRAVRFPQFLTSAYDIAKAKPSENFNQQLSKAASEGGQVILLDSGTYEKRWLRIKWLKSDFDRTVRSTPCHFAFCYDDPDLPRATVKQRADQIIRDLKRDRRKTAFKAIMPIIHTAHLDHPEGFPEICKRVVEAVDPAVIAIPERELGEGVFQAAQTIFDVRVAMNKSGRYYPLHILGTGNPLSILVYAACGADAFDGLDWCQTVVDHDTGVLYHSKQFDFFREQTKFGTQEEFPFFASLLAHNLLFYQSWMTRIRDSLNGGRINELCQKYLPDYVNGKLSAIFGGA